MLKKSVMAWVSLSLIMILRIVTVNISLLFSVWLLKRLHVLGVFQFNENFSREKKLLAKEMGILNGVLLTPEDVLLKYNYFRAQ